MARILICHVPKDGSLARDLGAALMGRGHFVSFDGEPDTPRADRSSRLRQFEAVAVLWTEASAQSAGLAEIARDAMPLNLLVPIRAEELQVARLPLAYRKLHMLAPRDIDGIARLVARLSTAVFSLREMAEREAQRKTTAAALTQPPMATTRPPPLPAPTLSATEPMAPRRAPASGPWKDEPVVEREAAPRARPLSDLPEVDAPPAADVFQRSEPQRIDPERLRLALEAAAAREDDRGVAAAMTASDLAVAVDAGLLEHHIPAAMWLGAPTVVELTLGRGMLAALPGGAAIETISVSLYSGADAFDIERQSERTQFVVARQGETGRDPATHGRWAWLVTPRVLGPQDLIVRIGALLRDRNGVPGPVAVPDRRFTIEIELPQGQSLISALAGWRPR